MTIRVEKRQQFAVVDSRAVNDTRLSMRARGVLVWLLDKPDGWRVSSEAIARQCSEGRDAIRKALKELEGAGYLHRQKVQGKDGRWTTESVVCEEATDDGISGAGVTPTDAEDTDDWKADAGNSGPLVTTKSDDYEPVVESAATPSQLPAPSRPVPAGVDPDVVERLCQHLAHRITQHRGARPKYSPAWAADMATLLNSGASGWEGPPPTPQQVATVIDAVFDRLNVRSGRGFCWADQVRSPQGLRGKWEQLTFALRDHQQAHPEVDDVLAAMNMLDKMGVRR